MHRVLQLAANLFESTTNSLYPSVYRPYFTSTNVNGRTVIFISGYELVNGPIDPSTLPAYFIRPLDLNNASDRSTILQAPTYVNIYGAPWVIGARKGFPNLNEVAIQSVAQLTRKLQVIRPNNQ